MEKKEKILLASTCGLGAVSIVFISLFAWKAATSGGGDVPPEPVNQVNVNFTTEGCKVYKDDKTVTSDKADKDVSTSYTIKLDDEYKQDYDFSEYSLKVYTLDGNEYDTSKYSFNFKSGALVINADQDLEIKCRATLAVTKFVCVCNDVEENYAAIQITGSFDYIDWGDGTPHTPYTASTIAVTYEHEYTNLEVGKEFVVRIVGDAYAFVTFNSGTYGQGPSYLKEAYFGHYVKSINSTLMAYCSVETVYFEDGIPSIGSISMQSSDTYNNLKSIRIPDTVTYLNGTFRNTQHFEEILIPNNVMFIASSLCSYSKINKVNFSADSKLTTLLPQAFNATIIESITLPKHVKRIDMQCFQNSKNLTTVDLSLLEEVPTVGYYDYEGDTTDNVFFGCESLEKIIVPKGKLEEYKNDESWKKQRFSSDGQAGEVLEKLVEAE